MCSIVDRSAGKVATIVHNMCTDNDHVFLAYKIDFLDMYTREIYTGGQ